MGLLQRAGDTFYTFRFLRLLTKSWTDMKAYEFGIIDENGKVLRKSRELKTSEEKSAYTLFHRLVFNLKRLLNKIPLGKTKLASYAAALFLIKENTNMSDAQIEYVLDKMGIDIESLTLEESANDSFLHPGVYKLTNDIASPSTGEIIAYSKSSVILDEENTQPIDTVLNESIYKVRHVKTSQYIYISDKDIDE